MSYTVTQCICDKWWRRWWWRRWKNHRGRGSRAFPPDCSEPSLRLRLCSVRLGRCRWREAGTECRSGGQRQSQTTLLDFELSLPCWVQGTPTWAHHQAIGTAAPQIKGGVGSGSWQRASERQPRLKYPGWIPCELQLPPLVRGSWSGSLEAWGWGSQQSFYKAQYGQNSPEYWGRAGQRGGKGNKCSSQGSPALLIPLAKQFEDVP